MRTPQCRRSGRIGEHCGSVDTAELSFRLAIKNQWHQKYRFSANAASASASLEKSCARWRRCTAPIQTQWHKASGPELVTLDHERREHRRGPTGHLGMSSSSLVVNRNLLAKCLFLGGGRERVRSVGQVPLQQHRTWPCTTHRFATSCPSAWPGDPTRPRLLIPGQARHDHVLCLPGARHRIQDL
jgi:hypothetical protein